MVDDTIDVEVAWAAPERQLIVPVAVPAGTTAAEAVRLSGIGQVVGEDDLDQRPLGVFGKRVKPDRVLVSGERVEIYRPLKADPKVVRRELAAMGKTMGRKRERKGQDPGSAATGSAEEG